jgi:hypothetical protein
MRFASNRRGHGYQIFVMDAGGATRVWSRTRKGAHQRLPNNRSPVTDL